MVLYYEEEQRNIPTLSIYPVVEIVDLSKWFSTVMLFISVSCILLTFTGKPMGLSIFKFNQMISKYVF
jgi:hypothetical protein